MSYFQLNYHRILLLLDFFHFFQYAMDAINLKPSQDRYLGETVFLHCVEDEPSNMPMVSCPSLFVSVRFGHISTQKELSVRRRVMFANTKALEEAASLHGPLLIKIENACNFQVATLFFFTVFR